MPLILLIDDDPHIVSAVEKTLRQEPGTRVETVGDAPEAVPAVRRLRPDLVLLDVRLPRGDGRRVLADLKSLPETRAVPVILLTGMSSEGDKVFALDQGADDYLVKPFGAAELRARIRAVLRRAQPAEGQGAVTAGALRLEPGERRAVLDGAALPLRPAEFALLYLLASHPGRTLPRAFLIERCTGFRMPVATRSLDTHIKNLRQRLGARAAWIETVPRLGYRFNPDA